MNIPSIKSLYVVTYRSPKTKLEENIETSVNVEEILESLNELGLILIWFGDLNFHYTL